MTKRRPVPGIRKVLDSVKRVAEARGVELDRPFEDAIRDYVNALVQSSADRLGISTQGWMASYSDLLAPEKILDFMLEAKAIRQAAMSGPPVTLDMHDLGRVIASLGQAVRMVSLNFEAPDQGLDLDAQAVLDGAGDGISSIGMSVASVSATGDLGHVTLTGESVGLARQALGITIRKFEGGEWVGQNDRITAITSKGMSRDLALLDPHI
jgi:hypothetical protein